MTSSPTPKPAEPVYGKCRECGEQFRLYRPWQHFCSARHRDRFKARTMRKQASAFRQQRDTPGSGMTITVEPPSRTCSVHIQDSSGDELSQ
jgi:hypothetical protein